MSAVLGAFDPKAFRWGSSSAPWLETVVIVLVTVAMTAACVLVLWAIRRHQQRQTRVADQWSALAVMGELCPHGWQAQITLYGSGAPIPDDAPQGHPPRVELEWQQFEGPSGEVCARRRAWAPSIDAALQSMVDGRHIDIALEQIEHAGSEEREV